VILEKRISEEYLPAVLEEEITERKKGETKKRK
jgi:hypothetical protein